MKARMANDNDRQIKIKIPTNHEWLTNFNQTSSASQSSSSALGSHDSVSGPSPAHHTKYWYPQPCRCSSTICSMNHSSPLSITTIPGLSWVLEGNTLGSLGMKGFKSEAW